LRDNLSAEIFIARLKPLLDSKRIVVQPRNKRKTWEFMLEHRLSADDVIEFLYTLTSDDYYEGPSSDDNGSPGSVMVFLSEYETIRIYIKIKIWKDETGDEGVVMSFHKEGDYD